jgi:K+ transporter
MLNISPPKLDVIFAVGIIVLLIFMIYNNRKSTLVETDNSTRLGVQELIEKVKSELIATEKKRVEANEAPLFMLQDFELEINFVVKENTTQKGDFDFKVITVGSAADYGSEKTQTIKLRMTAAQPQHQETPALDAPDKILTEPPSENVYKERRGKTK